MVKTPWGYTHENISRIWLEENVRRAGKRNTIHRIMGVEEGREKHSFVLDWGSNQEEVKAEYAGMIRHMRAGVQRMWDCTRYKLQKEV